MRRSLALVVLAVVLAPTAAIGHSNSVETNPERGATLDTLPAEATVTFAEPPTKADVVLSMPGGRIEVLTARIDGAVVVVKLPSEGPRGQYGLFYRVVASDGHPVSGSSAFTVTTGPEPADTPQPTSAPADEKEPVDADRRYAVPPLAVLGLSVMAIVCLALVAVRTRRR